MGIAAAVALAGLVVALVAPGWPRWLGTAAILTVAPLPWRAVADSPWWQRRKSRVPPVLLVALMVVVLAPLLRGDPPASRDHAIHYFQLTVLVEELVPSGRLWGWSTTLNHGYPFGESYPVLGYLWMCAAHWLSFGAVSLRTSYAWGLASVWMLSAGVAWWLAAMVTRELRGPSDSPEPTGASQDTDEPPARSPAEVAGWAGLAAACLWLLDTGHSRQGGWIYLMYHGVWPQLLAATLWAASLGLTWRALRDPRPRRLALAVLALGGSLWSHPFGLLTAAASAGMWAVLVLVGRHRWPSPWRTWIVVHGAGLLLGAGWLVTFFGSAEAMARAPVPWIPLAKIGTALVQGQLMPGTWVWAAPLGLLGAGVVFRRGGILGWAVLGLAVGQLVLASEEAITVLRLDLVLSGFKNLQFPRYAISFKPLWFALGGVGFGRMLMWSRARRSTPSPLDLSPIAWARRAAGALLIAPLIASLVPQAGQLLTRPVAGIDTLVDEDAKDEAALLAALRAEAQALPPERPLVVAVMRAGMGGGTYPVISVADAGGRLVLDEHIPTVNFKHRVSRRPAAYEVLGVTHVIHDRPLSDRERELASSLTVVDRFGPFTLERFGPPHGATQRIAELQGFGDVEVLTDEPERLDLQITDVEPGTELIIGRAPHLRWELSFEGEVLEIRELRRGGTSAMKVELPGPGRLELRYIRSTLERRAVWVSALMLLACLLGLLMRGPPLSIRPLSSRAVRLSWVVAAGLGVLLAIGLVMRQGDKLTETWDEFGQDELDRRADDDIEPLFVRDLVIEGEVESEHTPSAVCNGLTVKDGRVGCSEAAHRPRTAFLYREPFLYRCLRISIPPGGEATVRFPTLPNDEYVVAGSLIRHIRTGAGKRLYYGARWINQRMKNRLHDFVLGPAQLTDGRPAIGIRNESPQIEQVCISAALFRRPSSLEGSR